MKKLVALLLMLASVQAFAHGRGYGHGYRPAPPVVNSTPNPIYPFIAGAVIGGVIGYSARPYPRPPVVYAPPPPPPGYVGAYYCSANGLPYPTIGYCEGYWYWR